MTHKKLILHLCLRIAQCRMLCPWAALLWHLSVSEAVEHNMLHSLSAGQFSASNNDSMQLSDIDDSDDNLESNEADSTKNTDDSKDSEDVVM